MDIPMSPILLEEHLQQGIQKELLVSLIIVFDPPWPDGDPGLKHLIRSLIIYPHYFVNLLKYIFEFATSDLIQKIKRKPNMPRYIVDGFVFHVNITKGNPPMIYLRCLEYKRLGCHARAIIPYDGSIQDIKVKKSHNHPPDFAAEEKIVFMRELKEVMLKNPTVPSRAVYQTLAEVYPTAASETPFESIRHKMNRWRREIETKRTTE